MNGHAAEKHPGWGLVLLFLAGVAFLAAIPWAILGWWENQHEGDEELSPTVLTPNLIDHLDTVNTPKWCDCRLCQLAGTDLASLMERSVLPPRPIPRSPGAPVDRGPRPIR